MSTTSDGRDSELCMCIVYFKKWLECIKISTYRRDTIIRFARSSSKCAVANVNRDANDQGAFTFYVSHRRSQRVISSMTCRTMSMFD